VHYKGHTSSDKAAFNQIVQKLRYTTPEGTLVAQYLQQIASDYDIPYEPEPEDLLVSIIFKGAGCS